MFLPPAPDAGNYKLHPDVGKYNLCPDAGKYKTLYRFMPRRS